MVHCRGNLANPDRMSQLTSHRPLQRPAISCQLTDTVGIMHMRERRDESIRRGEMHTACDAIECVTCTARSFWLSAAIAWVKAAPGGVSILPSGEGEGEGEGDRDRD